jgi:hypothetical protein
MTIQVISRHVLIVAMTGLSTGNASEKCEAVRESAQLQATDLGMHDGMFVKYDDARHADLGSVMKKYWSARISHDSNAMKGLLSSLPEAEADRELRRETALWDPAEILEAEPIAVELRALDRIPRAWVFSRVLLRESGGQCVADVVATELEFVQDWRLRPHSSDAQVQPLQH